MTLETQISRQCDRRVCLRYKESFTSPNTTICCIASINTHSIANTIRFFASIDTSDNATTVRFIANLYTTWAESI
jgi:hypothetical protein